MNDHNLVYICKSTGKEFKGKTIASGAYLSLIDPDNGEKNIYSRHHFNKLFRCSRLNQMKNKPEHSKIRIHRKGMGTKAWREYLDGAG